MSVLILEIYNPPVPLAAILCVSSTVLLNSVGYGDPKLPHLSVDLQPRSPLLHHPCGAEPPPCHAHANPPAFSPYAVRIDCKKSCQKSGGNASGSSTIFRQKAVMPFPNSSSPMSVWMMDCR